MECLIAIGGSILGKIAESTVEPVGRLLGYLFYYRSNIDNLRNKVRDLDNSRTRLTEQVEEAEKKDEEIEAADQKVAVKKWLDESKKLSEEAWNFLANEGRIGMQHCSSCSMVSCYKSSKKAKEMKDLVVDKIKDGGEFSEVSFRSIIPNWIENEDYKAFETRMPIEDKIMEALRDSSVKAIGVYGMPGVGKTTLAKEIDKKTKREGLFDKVAMVSVSQTPDVEKIQQGIAEQLELMLNEKTPEKRADRLRDRLRKEDKLLIVLDDIWDELELGGVGIRFENDKKGCKLLFTSRSQDVGNRMEVNLNFLIEPLSPSEAMDLFKKMVGVRAEQADFKALAVDVVKECGELPIAIVTVAKALKSLEGVSDWKDALRQLRNSSPKNIEGVFEKVYSSVKLSFDSLTSEEAKSILLLCSLHEEDERIDSEDLMRYGVGWGLFRDLDTLDEARDRVNSLLDKLKARCLLLDGSYAHGGNSVRVMMHDVIRDVGISIASEKRRMVNFKTAFKLEECSSKGELKESTAIFLRDRNFSTQRAHIGKLECPELELFLSPYSYFLDVPDDFFEETKKLRALDLNHGNLESPPSSFFVLQNLVTLRLLGCKLGDVTFIGELKNLEILDLSHSKVAKLPRQIGKLTRLRLLDLRHCRDLKVIEAGVISKLKRLEELYMRNGFKQWEVEGVSNTSLSEIKNLSRLTILILEIPEASVLPKDCFPEKLEKFKISIGRDEYYFYDSQPFYRPAGIQSPNSTFCLKLMKSHQVADLEILMQKSEEFHLKVFDDVNIISVNELERKGFPRLKKFWLRDSGGMKYIVNSEGHSRPCSVFPNLERLELACLPVLEKICYGKLAEESFGKLSFLSVWACPRLKNVVQFSIAKRLEDITVYGCSMIKEIVFQSEDENEAQLIPEVEFPRLRRLYLADLPELVQFFWSHLETGTSVSSVLDCPMTPLFSEKVVFPSLIDLNLAQLNIKKLWPEQLPTASSSMQNLEKLVVDECHSLEYLLSSTMAKGFSQLQYLCVKNCRAIEEIIATKELTEKGISMECPSLSALTILNCPKLSTFLDTNSTKKDEQEGMSSVATLSLFQEKVVFPNLTELTLGYLKIKKLWPDQLPATSSFMQNLKKLEVDKCHSLEYLLSSTMAKGFSQLQYLCVTNCRAIEEIIATKELTEEGTSVECPNLSTLTILNCPKLSTFLDTNFTKKDEQEGMSSVATQPLFQEKRCGTLLPSFISFNNLKTLRVSHCPKVINLLASSTARGLVHLSTMSIIKCKQLTEIITTFEEDETEDEIVFRKLTTLVLDDLPSLRRFYSGNTRITFPKLEKLILSQCPELRSFSHGTINSSKLTSIITQIDYEKINNWRSQYFKLYEEAKPKELVWEGDINTTVLKLDPITSIRHLFMEA
ncbi:hypothetical protein UlMin_017644, partial [Ulmus minor]